MQRMDFELSALGGLDEICQLRPCPAPAPRRSSPETKESDCHRRDLRVMKPSAIFPWRFSPESLEPRRGLAPRSVRQKSSCTNSGSFHGRKNHTIIA